MLRSIVRGVLAVWLTQSVTTLAFAQSALTDVARPPSQCFEVHPRPAGDIAAPLAVMLNRCTGETFMLVRTEIPTADGRLRTFTLRWKAISFENGEAILSMSR